MLQIPLLVTKLKYILLEKQPARFGVSDEIQALFFFLFWTLSLIFIHTNTIKPVFNNTNMKEHCRFYLATKCSFGICVYVCFIQIIRNALIFKQDNKHLPLFSAFFIRMSITQGDLYSNSTYRTFLGYIILFKPFPSHFHYLSNI